ncbi:MAG: hypothetical protein CVV24_11540 [Ignavibacteriae bacterium HGW-Ignavibacteriae-3]|nr:MAG: hypothetical protein CVV24_11540 [Ignavibacteriae bacterium HGW-Ignavibacteriae-3]
MEKFINSILFLSDGVTMKKFKIIIAMLFGLFFSMTLQAQNFNDALRLTEPGIISGARALSMGNAYTGLSNDFSGSIFNPAGLGLVKKTEMTAGMNYNSFDNNAALYNKTTGLSASNTRFSQIGVALPFPTSQGSFVVSIGYSQLKDFNKTLGFNAYNSGNTSYIQDLTSFNDDIAFKLALSYPTYDLNNTYIKDVTVINGRLNQRGTINQEGGINSWTFSGAIEASEDLFVGATVNIYNGTFRKTNDYYEEDLNNNYPSSILLDPIEPGSADFKSFFLNQLIDWDISGAGLKLGALMKLENNINVGATIKLPTKWTVKETYSINGTSLFGTGKRFNYAPDPERFEYEISSPSEISAGASLIQNNFTASANVTLIDYSKMKFEGGLNNSSTISKNADIVALMRSVVNINAGAEYLLPNSKLALRGGFMLMPSPFKDDPGDYDKKFVTAGIGYQLSKASSINVAYVYGWWKDIGDNYGVNVSRTLQDVTFQNIVTSISFNL